MSKQTTSTKRVEAKNVTVIVQLFRNLSKMFKANDLQGCMQVLNYGDGRHSLATEFVKTVYGDLPKDYEDAWNSYPNTSMERSNPKLHATIGIAKQISDTVKLTRTECRAKARGTLTVNKEKRLLQEIQDVTKMLTEFTA